MNRLELTRPQNRFFNATERFVSYVGGFGSGKTTVGAAKLLALKFKYPRCNLLYAAPSYPLIRDIFYPTVAELLEGTRWETRYKVNKGANIVDFGPYGKILCRTLRPEKLIGFNVAAAVADEIDVLKKADAKACWLKLISRVRQAFPDGRTGQIMATTTPEGYRFTHSFFGKYKYPDRCLVQAATTTNPHLPPEYVQMLFDTYPEALVQAYIQGQFVNLVSGSVYIFNRAYHSTTTTLSDGEDLHIGMDFNVNRMATVVHVIRGEHVVAVDEIMGCADTPAVIMAIQARYGGRHKITIYPDASGGNRDTRNASRSDISLLIGAGFAVNSPRGNPLVRDRVLSVNVMLKQQRYWVNTVKCPTLAEALEQQVYTEAGAPDKTQGKDHPTDATGYFVHRVFAVVKRKAAVHTISL